MIRCFGTQQLASQARSGQRRPKFVPLIIAVWAIALLATHSEAVEPRLIPFQGRLTNADGSAVADGTVEIRFTIYDAQTNGTARWTERHFQPGVPVQGGQVNLLLGNLTSLDDPSLDFVAKTYFLGIKVGGDSNQEMVPRQQLVPSFHARTADVATLAKTVADNVVTGASIQSGTITTTNIGDGQVKSVDIGTGEVDNVDLKSNAVTSDKIQDGTITAADFAAGAVVKPLEIHARLTNNSVCLAADSNTLLIKRANMGLVMLRGSANLPCDGSTPPGSPGSDPCGADDGTIGLAFAITRPGDYEVCAEFNADVSVHCSTGAGVNRVDLTANYYLSETPANALNVLQQGEQRSQAATCRSTDDNIQSRTDIVRWCQLFTFGSIGQKVVRLMRKYQGPFLNLSNFGSCPVGFACSACVGEPLIMTVREILQ